MNSILNKNTNQTIRGSTTVPFFKTVVRKTNHKPIAILVTLFVLLVSNTSICTAKKYTLIEKNTSDKIGCNQIWLVEETFKCLKDGALYLYPTEMISTVKLKKTILYPFDRTVRLNEEVLATKDCQYIIKHLPGPLLLEKSVEAYLFAGHLYEHGQCVTKNPERAVSYYQKAGNAGKSKCLTLKKKLLAIEAKKHPERSPSATQDLVRNLQQASDIKRIRKEMQTKICNSECSQSYSTHNKYRIEPQCFADCMIAHGF